jgi:hypothetical protein
VRSEDGGAESPSLDGTQPILAPAVVGLLCEQRLAPPFKGGNDFLFANSLGRGLNYRHVGDVFRAAVRGCRTRGCWQALASRFIRCAAGSPRPREGAGRRLRLTPARHANPNVTLGVCAHLFARRERAEAAREALEASFEAMVGTTVS